jgi:hypothetical protein
MRQASRCYGAHDIQRSRRVLDANNVGVFCEERKNGVDMQARRELREVVQQNRKLN